eukprot:TRINITY_DN681_c0_g1_i11.p1 TRINITY_DN681_c0_g1~~TRINITY_DN681_c0_g1_i11.p1  ORF type:complete len:414 (-),score=88.12 TRINITY_DN681_c0_g1_i11:80-1276(-)
MTMRVTAAVVALLGAATALDNGMGLLPPMGWNTWCTDDYCGLTDWCSANEVERMANTMVTSGMHDLGYEYIVLDDCWGGPRDPVTNELTADPKRFPDGMQPVIDHVHRLGLKFGLYLCAGTYTCKFKRPGSWGYFELDANTVASWKVDFVKMDWCNHPDLPPEQVYKNFSDCLNATGRPIFFNVCDWGEGDPWLWGMETANSWRVHHDHLPVWNFQSGILDIVNAMAGLSPYAGPGGWNDPDFLETGLFPLTTEESITEMSMWSIFAAPLFVATNIRNMSDDKAAILMNEEVIAVDQDPLGIAGDRMSMNTTWQVWYKPLNGGAFAIALLNTDSSAEQLLTVHFADIPKWPLNTNYGTIRDLWQHKDLGIFESEFSSVVPSRGTTLVKITPTVTYINI